MHSRYDEIQAILDKYKEQLNVPYPAEWPQKVQRVVAFIIAHLFDPRLTVSWMREQCRINGKSLSADFFRYVRYYPKEYIIYLRIEAGKLLLQQTEATVTQIALAVGFNSLSSFCNTFKNKEVVRPTEWREQDQN